MTTYRISDEATSTEITAETGMDAGEQYFAKYDTGDMEAGETLRIRVYTGPDLMDHSFDFVVEADGKGGVAAWE